MLKSGYINFFNVDKCGLYRLFSDQPKSLQLAETFSKLSAWKQGRNFEATNPWDARKHRNKTPCYWHEVHSNEENGDYLLVLWKGDSDRHGPLYGITINPDGTTEKAIKQTESNSKKPMVWGRPCYYWVIPELNMIASIKFDNSRTDSKMFQEWITGCINLRVDLPEAKKITTEKEFVKIEFPADKDDNYRYSFQFDISMKSLATSSFEMKELAKKVTHIIKRETVSIKSVDKRRGFAKFFQRFEVPYTSAENNSSRQVELRIESKPTEAEIQRIIEAYAEDHEPGSWERTGFAVEGTNSIVWASKYRLTQSISLDDGNSDIFGAEDLYKYLLANRDVYLEPIRKDERQQQEAANA